MTLHSPDAVERALDAWEATAGRRRQMMANALAAIGHGELVTALECIRDDLNDATAMKACARSALARSGGCDQCPSEAQIALEAERAAAIERIERQIENEVKAQERRNYRLPADATPIVCTEADLLLAIAALKAASCDTRRMAETGNTDSVRSTGGAVDAEGSETPKGHHP